MDHVVDKAIRGDKWMHLFSAGYREMLLWKKIPLLVHEKNSNVGL